MDNSLLTACQNAANEAMIRVCGDTESCDITMGTNGVTDTLSYRICKERYAMRAAIMRSERRYSQRSAPSI